MSFRKTKLIASTFFGFFVSLFWFISPAFAVDQVCNQNLYINEFSPLASTEWVELVNHTDSQSCNLADYLLVITDGLSVYNEYELSGTLPKYGFLTFDLPAGYLPDDGACMVVFVKGTNDSTTALRYGNKDCDNPDRISTVTDLASLTASGSIGSDEQPGGSWMIYSAATKGWCNSSAHGCPSISTITSNLTTEGVSTNLGSQADYSRTSGLYFEKSENGTPVGKITFLQEINFTDQDSLSWMQQLDSKLDISQGIISLDADLINNLVNTSAQLTMYNITLNNPRILVDGQEDTGGIVSSLSYDRSASTLTFTAAHFTTFSAVEATTTSSSSTGGGGTAAPPGCGELPPGLKRPNLFYAVTDRSSADLYFTPADDPVTDYYVVYGLASGEERYAASFPYGSTFDVVNYKVKDLASNTDYYFKVRAGDGCAPGGWSNELKVRTEPLVKIAGQSLGRGAVGKEDQAQAKKEAVLGAATVSSPPPRPQKTSLPTVEPTIKPTSAATLIPLPPTPPTDAQPGRLERILNKILNLFGR